MSEYIDGFVFPIARNQIAEYQRIAESVAAIYREHGAIDYLEYVGDDMNREGTKSFHNAIDSAEGDTIVFGWIVFESRESRDVVNKKIEEDPRMVDLVAPLMNASPPIFDPKKMAYAGFRKLVHSQSDSKGN